MEEGNELADDTADDTVAQSFACSFDSLTSGEKGDQGEDVEGRRLFVNSKLMSGILCCGAPWFRKCTIGEVRLA